MLNFVIGFVRAKAWLLAMIVCAVALALYLFRNAALYQYIPYLVGNGVGETLSSIGKHLGSHDQFLPLVLAITAIWFRSSAALWFLAVAMLSNLPELAIVFQGWTEGRIVWDAPQVLLRTTLPLAALVLSILALYPRGRKTALSDAGSIVDRRLKIAVIVASGIALIACLSLVPDSVRDNTTFANLIRLKLLAQPELLVLFPAFLSTVFHMRAAPWLHGLALLYLLDDVQQNLRYLLRHGRHFANGDVELIYAAACAVALGCAVFFVWRKKGGREAE